MFSSRSIGSKNIFWVSKNFSRNWKKNTWLFYKIIELWSDISLILWLRWMMLATLFSMSSLWRDSINAKWRDATISAYQHSFYTWLFKITEKKSDWCYILKICITEYELIKDLCNFWKQFTFSKEISNFWDFTFEILHEK